MEKELDKKEDIQILKSINLNSTITDNDLSKVFINKSIADKLLMQDGEEDVTHHYRT